MISVIIVTFNPNIEQLNKTILSLYNQIDKIVIVKNSQETIEFSMNEKITILQLPNNYGIAYAQNQGIKIAFSKKADFILFSDQDTVYPDNYVKNCLNSFYKNSLNRRIAAITPLFYNENKQQLSQIMISKTKAITPVVGNIYKISHAISSGSFCPSNSIKEIGMMNERLFIDYVDNEWCWRANKKGFDIIVDTNIRINHFMGDNYKSIFGKKFVTYSNFRNYFFFRNSYYLLFHSHLFSSGEFFSFLFYTKLKTIIFFLTKGFSLNNFILLQKAKYKGIFNNFSLEEEIK